VVRSLSTAIVSEATNDYDELDRLIMKKDGTTTVQKIVYNINSLQKFSYDADDHCTEYLYDDNNRLIQTSHTHDVINNVPIVHTMKQGYDYAGNIRSKKDGRTINNEENETNYIYDEFDRLWYVVNAKGEKTRYTYDKNGNILTQETLTTGDVAEHTVTYEYNVANKVTKRIDNGGRTGTPGAYTYNEKKFEQYKYNPKGELVWKQNRSSADNVQDGTVTEYEYDIHGRLKNQKSERYGADPVEISYNYDNNGNQLQVTDSTGTIERQYDQLNRVITKKVPQIGTARYYYDRIICDVNGTDYLTAETSVNPGTNAVATKVYDNSGKLKYVIDEDITSLTNISYYISQLKVTTYKYYADGSRQEVEYPGGATERYTYYKDGLIKTLINRDNAGNLVDSFTYTYDEAHNMSTKQETVNNVYKGITSYQYDKLNRLESVNEGQIGRTTVYTYDLEGNRKTEEVTYGTTAIKNTYNYNDQNFLISVVTTNENNNSSIIKTVEYVNDENGNQITVTRTDVSPNDTIARYSYDLLNRMTRAETNGQIVISTYNGEGLRATKSVNGILTRYMYEYDKVVLEISRGSTEVNIYGTNLLMKKTNNGSYYYMYNGPVM
jgi:YD repeat-containing protein